MADEEIKIVVSPSPRSILYSNYSKDSHQKKDSCYRIEEIRISHESNVTSSTPSTERTTIAKRVWRDWWLEVLAGIFITFNFSGLIALLRAYQRQPLPDWPLGLSFNIVLSIFGAVFRAPILFIAAEGLGQLKWQWLRTRRPLSDLSTYDDAARGPWGSINLVLAIRWRDLLASLAAVITVASIGIDAFTQAVVSYESCITSLATNTSTITRLNSFFSRDNGAGLPPWARVGLVNSFSDAASIKPTYSCPSESCLFSEPYHSIGLCSSCKDMTKDLVIDCSPKEGSGCNYTLWMKYDDIMWNTTTGYRVVPLSEPDAVTDRKTSLFDLLSTQKYGVLANDSYASYNSSQIDLVSAWPTLASRCTLFYCVRSFTARIDRGILVETPQSTSSNWSTWSADRLILNTVKVSCLKPHVQKQLLEDSYISVETEWMAWDGIHRNGTEREENISQSTEPSIPITCLYQLQLVLDVATPPWHPVEFYADLLSGTMSGAGMFIGELDSTAKIYPSASGKSFMVELWNNGTISADSISKAFDNFTLAATNYMRQGESRAIPMNVTDIPFSYNGRLMNNLPLNHVHGEPKDWNQPATGRVFKETTCIHVRWPWLALPTAIFIATLIFLFLLIIKSNADREVQVWKSSQNALIWHGLDGHAEKEGVDLVSVEDMESRAKEVHVQLAKTRRGWKLAQQE